MGWVGLGRFACGLGWVGLHEMDPWTTLSCAHTNIENVGKWAVLF
jgi:hypothetical protein